MLDLDFGKYLFIQEYKDSKITHEFDGQTDLYEVIEQFEHFLRGAGFHFEGHLDIVNEEEEESSVDDMTDAEMFLHSKYEGDYVQDPAKEELYDGDGTPQPDFEPTVTFKHSEYYFDTERNR